MSWPSSIGIGVLSAALGLVCGGFIAHLCVGWYRVTSFEGRSGYFLVATALLGGLVAFVLGLVVARFMAADAPSFLKVLGAAAATVVIAALVALALCRLFADPDPTLGGKELELEIELRCPPSWEPPAPGELGPSAGVFVPGGRALPTGELRVNDGAIVDGRRVVPATVPLTTRATRKFLRVRFDGQLDLLFALSLRARPNESDFEWSEWVASGWSVGEPEPPDSAKFHARYRVRFVEPPPPEPDHEALRTQAFALLGADAPLERWLPYLFEAPNAERTAVVLQRIDERQLELAALIRSSDARMRGYALRATSYAKEPIPEVIEAVIAEGRAIADGMREADALSADDPRCTELLRDLDSRFRTWRDAWWGLSLRLGLDGRPPLQELHDLAVASTHSAAMRDIALDAQAVIESLAKSAAEKKP